MESLTLENVYFIGQTIAAIAVVISLVYVGLQVQQNTNATQMAAAQSTVEMYNTFTSDLCSSSELSDLWRRGLRNFNDLKDTEKVRFSALAGQSMKVFESAHLQWNRGALDDDLWKGLSFASCDVANQPGLKQWWSFRKQWYGDAFQKFVDDHLDTNEPNLMYSFSQTN